MFRVRCLIFSLSMMVIAADPISAQARALILYGYGGRMLSLTDLSDAGDNLGPGAVYGGGIGLQLHASSALRASFSSSRADLRGPTINTTDPAFERYYVGADLMIGTPTDAGLAPYFFLGGGRVAVDPVEGGEGMASIAGRAGTGVNYVPDNSMVVLFAELGGWLYRFQLLGFDRLQINTAILGGLALAVPF